MLFINILFIIFNIKKIRFINYFKNNHEKSISATLVGSHKKRN